MKRLGVALVVAVTVALLAPVSEASASVGWTIKASPNKIARHGSLGAISCPGTAICEAVGFATNSSGAQVGLAEHWNGSSWSLQAMPTPAGAAFVRLSGLSCAAATQCEAVGLYGTSSGIQPLVEALSGTTWTIQPTPTPSGAVSTSLSGVSCPAATQCTAVGNFFNGSMTVTLVEQWNGTTWSIQPSPNPSGSTFTILNDVSCTNATACTAVGNYNNGLTLAERWDGTSWNIQSTPNPSGPSNVYSVSCPAVNYCTLVGSYQNGPTTVPLAEGWNGTTWTVLPVPLPSGATGALLLSVSCTASSQCAAVGYYFTTSNSLTLAEGWNGTSWAAQSTPNPSGTLGSFLFGVSCPSASMCVAAGAYFAGAVDQTLAETWNGATWSFKLPPNPSGAVATFLNGVSCTSATSCTAVGNYGLFKGAGATLAMVWNGTSWALKSTPNPSGGGFNMLTGVSCSSASACTAVGTHASASSSASLAERWNGASWKIQPTPNPTGAFQSNLLGVSCPAATACTAVGSYFNGSAGLAFAEAWNGATWNLQSIPNPSGTSYSTLSGVSCTAPTACTGVGSYSNGSMTLTLAEQWNGTSWNIQTTPNPSGAMSSSLNGVSCASATQCTAVGTYQSGASSLTLAEQWNGTIWTIQPTPNPSGATNSNLFGISCPTATQCTAVGNYSTSSSNVTLAEQWNGTSWNIQTTPNPSGSFFVTLGGTSCPTTTACMAVGVSFGNSGPKTLTEQWTG